MAGGKTRTLQITNEIQISEKDGKKTFPAMNQSTTVKYQVLVLVQRFDLLFFFGNDEKAWSYGGKYDDIWPVIHVMYVLHSFPSISNNNIQKNAITTSETHKERERRTASLGKTEKVTEYSSSSSRSVVVTPHRPLISIIFFFSFCFFHRHHPIKLPTGTYS